MPPQEWFEGVFTFIMKLKIYNLFLTVQTNIDCSWWSDIATKIDPLQIFLTNFF